ncbi:hypothetical protein, partial [Stenotrophomonas maltophilia]
MAEKELSQYQDIGAISSATKLAVMEGGRNAQAPASVLASFVGTQLDASGIPADVEALKAGQQTSAIYADTLADLQALVGTYEGQGAFVTNGEGAGQYRWDGAAWQFLRADVLTQKADKSVVETEQQLNEGRFSQMHGMVEVEVGTEIPLVLDNTGKGIAGIETSDLTLTGVTATPNPAATAALFQAEDLGAVEVEAGIKIPFLLDSRKRGVCGYDLATGKFWPDQGGGSSVAVSLYVDTPLPADYKVLSLSVRLHIQQYGQSL